jgi:hypothetical protein
MNSRARLLVREARGHDKINLSPLAQFGKNFFHQIPVLLPIQRFFLQGAVIGEIPVAYCP